MIYVSLCPSSDADKQPLCNGLKSKVEKVRTFCNLLAKQSTAGVLCMHDFIRPFSKITLQNYQCANDPLKVKQYTFMMLLLLLV